MTGGFPAAPASAYTTCAATCTSRIVGRGVVYPARVSEKLPQNYILHTIVLFIVLVTAMILFLRYQWG